MKINYYRYPNAQGEDESWQNCQFTHNTDLSPFTQVKPLVTLNGQPIIRQHHSTYLTGKDTCRAHHFAKFLAIQVLKGVSDSTSPVPCAVASATAPVSNAHACKVLWIDTLHGPHICTSIYRELVAHSPSKESLHFVCLDVLGSQRENVYAINRNIEALIKQLKPELVVIDDIDHFMPFCGVHVATEFCRIVRDVTNHTETAFLFIGYNHLGKKASLRRLLPLHPARSHHRPPRQELRPQPFTRRHRIPLHHRRRQPPPRGRTVPRGLRQQHEPCS